MSYKCKRTSRAVEQMLCENYLNLNCKTGRGNGCSLSQPDLFIQQRNPDPYYIFQGLEILVSYFACCERCTTLYRALRKKENGRRTSR